MISVSDILKLLDQLPVWKTLKVLPDRIAALEARVAELERGRITQAKPGQTCPACGMPSVFRTSHEPSKGPFGALGARDEIWTCKSCGDEDHRNGVKTRA